MKTIGYFTLILLFLLGACKKEQDAGVLEMNKEVTLKTGDILDSKPDNLYIKVLNINDSRCPIGVVCVWQGEATVNLEVKAGTVFEVELSTFHDPVDTVNNFIFRLIDVLPYPVYGVEVPEKDKKVVLKIDRL